MIVRVYDRSKDNLEDVARLNPFPEQTQKWLATQYAAIEFPEQNLILAEDNGKLVGCLHIFDGGFPWVFVDDWWLEPDYRTFANARMMCRFAEQELQRRGVRLYHVYADERLSKLLVRTGMVCRSDGFNLLSKLIEE